MDLQGRGGRATALQVVALLKLRPAVAVGMATKADAPQIRRDEMMRRICERTRPGSTGKRPDSTRWLLMGVDFSSDPSSDPKGPGGVRRKGSWVGRCPTGERAN